ncbi:hypothetical protein VB712_00210 [Spirulina sp. CCNP1310]|uniref:hypothetical protein n=1 Tax=Spirulina sp. CCNP1310 TaxID=3110249 RepID=UPI002B1EF440|nr:hypothetical protein [Spirulina sp. CCNP1310]MEA5417623.1 hypothetical protein [Spirulina sp. CCNP1310]
MLVIVTVLLFMAVNWFGFELLTDLPLWAFRQLGLMGWLALGLIGLGAIAACFGEDP